MSRRNKILVYVALALCIAASVVFGLPQMILLKDATANTLLTGLLSRVALTAFLVGLFFAFGYARILRAPKKGFWRSVLWCLPCLAVAVVNFPFSALIRGCVTVERTDLVPLFLLSCVLIGMTEELLFRGLLHDALKQAFMKKRGGYLLALLSSSAIFALWHLINLLFGASVPATLLQVGYTFLLGVMFAVTLDKTGNIWLCVFLHALFDIGGTLILTLGSGNPQDLIFWILTAVIGALCAVHIVIAALRINKLPISWRK